MRTVLTPRTWLAAFFGRGALPEAPATVETVGPKRADDEPRLPERDESFYWAWFMHGHC